MTTDFKTEILNEFRGTNHLPKKDRTRPIAEGVEIFLKKAGLDRKAIEAKILQQWPEIVGKFNASHSTPLTIKNSILTVGVSNSVILYEFERQKNQLIKKIEPIIGKNKIRKIIFKVGAE